jgi:hypothetical protein
MALPLTVIGNVTRHHNRSGDSFSKSTNTVSSTACKSAIFLPVDLSYAESASPLQQGLYQENEYQLLQQPLPFRQSGRCIISEKEDKKNKNNSSFMN